ncbi:hypothetical protein JCM14719A_13490 [Calditerricola satsumensis]
MRLGQRRGIRVRPLGGQHIAGGDHGVGVKELEQPQRGEGHHRFRRRAACADAEADASLPQRPKQGAQRFRRGEGNLVLQKAALSGLAGGRPVVSSYSRSPRYHSWNASRHSSHSALLREKIAVSTPVRWAAIALR